MRPPIRVRSKRRRPNQPTLTKNSPAATSGRGLTPVDASGVEAPAKLTPGSTPELELPAPPEVPVVPPAASLMLAPLATVAVFVAVAAVADLVAVAVAVPAAAVPLDAPAPPGCDELFGLVVPHVGDVAPACTSAGVKSPQAYASFSSAVGATAPGTSAVTVLTPYCSKERPRDA